MNKIYKIFFYFAISISFTLILLIFSYLYKPSFISQNILNNIVSHETKIKIKKYFIQKNLKKHINKYSTNQFINIKLNKIKLGFDYNRSGNLNHVVYQNYGHIDIWENRLIFANYEGKIFYFDLKNLSLSKNIKKKLIKTNLSDLSEKPYHGIKDILINKNYIYISYVKEIKKDCLGLIIKKAELNLNEINFEKFFSPKKCVHKSETLFGISHPGQGGGKLAIYKNDKILLSTGNFRSLSVSQDSSSIYGKILEIDANNQILKILSKGHRNPQGLVVDANNIISTEHGPYGGDEINLIVEGGNYGFPVASYGEKYTYTKNQETFDYKKSHDGFNEPIFSFVPSIGISQIIRLPNNFNKKWQNNFLLSSLNGNSIYRIEFSKDFKKILFYETIYLGERIRDIIYDENNKQILMIFEETGSLAILSNS